MLGTRVAETILAVIPETIEQAKEAFLTREYSCG